MVRIEGDTFTMGCIEAWFFEEISCREGSNKPGHQVLVPSFAISEYEVTQDLWEAVMGKNPTPFKGCAECPVSGVSWDDIQVFLEKLNALTGESYRLPTEAEWEYAARGGHQNQEYDYGIGDSVRKWRDKLNLHAMHSENAGPGSSKRAGDVSLWPVGSRLPNVVGLYDMRGNVYEWVEDCWNDDYNGAPDDGSAWRRGDLGGEGIVAGACCVAVVWCLGMCPFFSRTASPSLATSV